jgi:hypothetical protein
MRDKDVPIYLWGGTKMCEERKREGSIICMKLINSI